MGKSYLKPKPDLNEQVARAVSKATDSEPFNGEEGLASPDLQRQLREAKEQERLRAQPRRK